MMKSIELPACLECLPTQMKDQLQTTLANDEASTDEEIVALWTEECGISKDAAEAAIKFRDQFFLNPLLDLFKLFPI